MYRSKFKDRADAQEYYIDMVNKGKCSPKFQEHYARVVQSIPYADVKVKVIKPVTLPTLTAIPFETDIGLSPNEIVIDDGVIKISG